MKLEKNVSNERNVIKQFSGVVMDARDFKIYTAMISNLELFIRDADQKSSKANGAFSPPTFTVGFSIQRELTELEKNIEELQDLMVEALEDDDMKTHAILERTLNHLKANV